MKLQQFHVYLVVCILSLHVRTSQGARILGIFTLPAKSHFICNHAIMKSLIDVGHQVTVITPFPKEASEANYTSIIDTSNKNQPVPNHHFVRDNKSSETLEFVEVSTYEVLDVVIEMGMRYCEEFLNIPEIRNILQSDEKLYDVVFVETLFLYECYFSVAEKQQIPIIGTITSRSSVFADRSINNLYHPGYIPFELSDSWEPNSFLWRLWNVWDTLVCDWYKNFVIIPSIRQFHNNHKKLLGFSGKFVDMQPALTFYNNHPSYLPRPMNPNAIEIGGISIKKPKPLPKDLRKFIDEAKHGVILFSFGSITQTSMLPKKTLKAFREAFTQIPQRVIWKFEQEVDDIPSNVMLKKWLPQRDILEHKNVKAFISHCGQGGIYDAIYSSTPILGIPLCADQPSNAAILQKLGVTILLDIENITPQNLVEALNGIINDTQYRDNMQKLTSIIKDRPMTPQQTVVFWTEYIIRHNGASHLKTASTQLNWFQYLLLDVFCFISLVFVAILYVIFYLTKLLYCIHWCRLRKTICKHFSLKSKNL